MNALSMLVLAAVHLQSLVPTSGRGADLLLDGNPATGWNPTGDPRAEGVLFRFEEPVALSKVTAAACPSSAEFRVQPYVNGVEVGEPLLLGPGKIASTSQRLKARSVFLRVVDAKGAPCVSDVAFETSAGALAVAPPRRVVGTISASSVLSPADAYHPGYLFDGRTDFGWVEGAKELGVGESLTLTLEKPVTLAALELWNGYQRSEDHFKKNARAKRLTVSLDGGEPVTLEVKDAMGPQRLKLPKPAQAKVIRLVIEQAVKGTKYADLVLSELRLVDQAGPLGVSTPDMSERQGELEKEIAGRALSSIVDRGFEQRCQRANLKLRTNHTFVSYLDATDEESGATEVFDGAWIVKEQAAPWSKVELFGRRHRTEPSSDPYGSGPSETVRISGGVVSIARVADLGKDGFATLVAEWFKGPSAEQLRCLGEDAESLKAKFGELVKQEAIAIKGTAVSGLYAR